MKKLVLALCAMGAATLATPAMAANTVDTTIVDPCSAGYVQGAVACQGYYGKNWITGGVGSATTQEQMDAIYALLNGTAQVGDLKPTDNTNSYTPPYTGDFSHVLAAVTGLSGANQFVFSNFYMTGLTVVGAHFGNNTDSDKNNVTAFWLVDLGATPTNAISLNGSGDGTSNAQVFATNVRPAVPEPATWAMMLLGFGAIGMASRRSRKPVLAQIA
ncbi:PEPxxWA-CTERM sorting domain-containing protein [Sphingomonas flavescens]|uniref:PEPxxWA-CTERM sorting domain-containing protein n=1 Tax=Sphingomonas flavescens TaxID=3132797 RepID=UPI002805151E|nr:PEPxxWA-CTERM sorting domain-containing protein [Sphingomonas limnosediminicola]